MTSTIGAASSALSKQPAVDHTVSGTVQALWQAIKQEDTKVAVDMERGIQVRFSCAPSLLFATRLMHLCASGDHFEWPPCSLPAPSRGHGEACYAAPKGLQSWYHIACSFATCLCMFARCLLQE